MLPGCVGKNIDLDINSLYAEMHMHINKFHLPDATTTKTTTESISVCVSARNERSFWNIDVSISYVNNRNFWTFDFNYLKWNILLNYTMTARSALMDDTSVTLKLLKCSYHPFHLQVITYLFETNLWAKFLHNTGSCSQKESGGPSCCLWI